MLHECLTFLFNEYERANIKYCVLRNYEGLPESNVGSDIDLLIQRDSVEMNHCCIMKMISALKIDYVSTVKRQYLTRYTLFKVLDNEIFSLVLDFHKDEEWKGAVYLSGDDILKARQSYKMFFVPSPVHESFVSWLSPLLSGGTVKARYAKKIIETARTKEFEIRSLILKAFSCSIAEQAIELLKKCDLEKTLQLRKEMQKSLYISNLKRGPFAFLGRIILFLLYELKMRISPPISFMAVIGPDGTGKTTVIEALSIYFIELFKTKKENINIFHFRPGLLPNLKVLLTFGRSREAEDNFSRPHRAKPSGFIGSLFRLLYYFLDYLVGYVVKVCPLLARNQLVIFDRYFYDFIVDPFRSRIRLPRLIRMAFLRLVPKPNLVVYLDNMPEAILARKQELAFFEIERQVSQYRHLAEELPIFLTVDSNKSVHDIVREISTEYIKRITKPIEGSFIIREAIFNKRPQ